MRVGGDCLKYFKRGGTEKRGGETKIFKKGGKLGKGVGALKRGAGTSLWTMPMLDEIESKFMHKDKEGDLWREKK